jgi:hypothetical protein
MGTATGIIKALNSGIKHIAVRRFTLRYPEQKLKMVGDGYQFDPVSGVGIAGYICFSTTNVQAVSSAQLLVRVLLRQSGW